MDRCIIIAVDGSEHAIAAVRRGVELARELRTRVVIVHATPSEETAGFGRAILDSIARVAAVPTDALRILRIGDAAPVIREEASKHGAELVVVGVRGSSARGDGSIGGVTTGVIRHAGRPVLVVSAPA